MEYKSDTLTDDVLSVLRKLSGCSEAMAWCEQYLGYSWGELVDNIEAKECSQGWVVWFLVIFGEKTDHDLRKKIIYKIKDPMTAFRVYLNLAWLTDEEDKLLEDKFIGKLPTAESELKNGIVKRLKWR